MNTPRATAWVPSIDIGRIGEEDLDPSGGKVSCPRVSCGVGLVWLPKY